MKKGMFSMGLAAIFGFSSVFANLAIAADAPQINKYVVSIPEKYFVKYDGNNKAEFAKGLRTGFGSGIAVKSVKKDGTIEFYFITDRGPNADGPEVRMIDTTLSSKFFPSPSFQPTIAIGQLKDGKVEITKTVGLQDENGKALTGLPIKPGIVGASNEAALDENLNNLGYDSRGLDTEGIALDAAGNFWVCDEYGPFIAKFNKKGTLLKKYAPGAGLPEILKDRIPNRGFEGLTVAPNGKVYAVVQSVLDINASTAKTAQFVRIVELDPATGATRMFAYPIDVEVYKSPKDAKIGDLYAISNTQMLLIEQGKGADKKMRNLIYVIDLKDATDISGLKIDGKDPEFISDRTKLSSIKFASKKLVVDLRAHGWEVEKAEGITLLPDRKTIVVVNDNDFGIALDLKDEENKKSEIGDYSLTPEGTLVYKGKTAKPSIRVVPNDGVEGHMYLWTIELPEIL